MNSVFKFTSLLQTDAYLPIRCVTYLPIQCLMFNTVQLSNHLESTEWKHQDLCFFCIYLHGVCDVYFYFIWSQHSIPNLYTRLLCSRIKEILELSTTQSHEFHLHSWLCTARILLVCRTKQISKSKCVLIFRLTLKISMQNFHSSSQYLLSIECVLSI